MTASPDLFNLIKSLTPSEKRYFKIFASKHVIGNKNNYEKLFDAMDALPPEPAYDEAAFKHSLKGKSWVKNFAVEKNQLEDLLMKSLRNYNAEKTVDGELQNLIVNLDIYLNKGLIDVANKALDKAFILANKRNNLTTLITLYQYKILLSGFTQSQFGKSGVEEDFAEDNRVMQMLDSERRTHHLKRKMYNLFVAGKLHENIEEGKKMIDELDILAENLPSTAQAKINCLSAKALFFENEGQFTEAMESYHQVLALIEKNKDQLKDPDLDMRKYLANYLISLHRLERFDEFPAIIEKIEQLPTETIREKAATFRCASQFRLLYFLNTDGGEGSKELVHDIERGLKKFAPMLPRKVVADMRYNICVMYFKQGNFSDLLNALNKAYNTMGRDALMITMARDLKFIEALAHVSLGNYDVVDYHLHNLERWLREHKLNNDFTAMLLKAIKKLMQPGTPIYINGQLAEANCPQNMLELREILTLWKRR